MKIAIIADIHDNLPNLKSFLKWSEKEQIETIICCGDVANEETLKLLSKKFLGKIHLVLGNNVLFNEDIIKKLDNINLLGRIGVVEVDGVFVGICHYPREVDEVIKKYAPQIIFYGHTHKPWIEKRRGIKVINPGTLGGVFQGATFAFWETETKQIKLILLETL